MTYGRRGAVAWPAADAPRASSPGRVCSAGQIPFEVVPVPVQVHPSINEHGGTTVDRGEVAPAVAREGAMFDFLGLDGAFFLYIMRTSSALAGFSAVGEAA